MSDTARVIQQAAGTYGADPVRMMKCTVDSVDAAKRLCMVSPINDNMESFRAYLMAQVDDGVLILPKVGSTVKVLFSNMNAPTVIQFSSIDKVFIVTGDSTLLVYADGLELYGNNFGGLVKVEALVQKINALENIINNLMTSVTSVPTPGTLADATTLKAGILTGLGSGIPAITNRSQLENTKVQHGNT